MITVYHGSSVEIPKPSLDYGRANTDFGAGFYVTESYEMAEKWACRRGMSVINEYRFDTSDLNGYNFNLDEKWLNFVINNRNEDLPEINTDRYDYLRGATADDKLFSTIEQYENGFMSQETAIKVLNCMNIGTQICIKSEKGLENLYYVGKTVPSDERKQQVQQQNREERKIANLRTKEIIQQSNKSSISPHRFDSALTLTSNIQDTKTDKFDITNPFNQ